MDFLKNLLLLNRIVTQFSPGCYHPISYPLYRCITKVHYLFYIVYHAVEYPLDIYFDLSSQGESVQPFVRSYIGKHRLYYCNAMRVQLPSMLRINLCYHLLRVVPSFFSDQDQ